VLPSCHEVSSFYPPYPLHHKTSSQAQKHGSQMTMPETMRKNKPFFLLSYLSKVLCHTNTILYIKISKQCTQYY
jgi:hypothetical protein